MFLLNFGKGKVANQIIFQMHLDLNVHRLIRLVDNVNSQIVPFSSNCDHDVGHTEHTMKPVCLTFGKSHAKPFLSAEKMAESLKSA